METSKWDVWIVRCSRERYVGVRNDHVLTVSCEVLSLGYGCLQAKVNVHKSE